MNVIVYGHFKGDLDPLSTYSPFEFSVELCAYSRLVRLDENGRIIGDLASSWTISSDGRTYRFKLDPQSQATPEQVLSQLKRAIGPDSRAMHKSLLRSLFRDPAKGFKQISNREIEISISRPYPPFLYLLSSPEFAIPVATEPGGIKKGTGPFEIQVKEANKDFLLTGRGNKSRVIGVQVVSDLSAIKSAVLEGRVHLVLGLPLAMMDGLNIPAGYEKVSGSFANPIHFQFNKRSKIFASPSVRRDLASLIASISSQWANSQSSLKYHRALLPPGLLPVDYYQAVRVPDSPNPKLEAATVELVNRHGLKVWMSPSYVPSTYTEAISQGLKSLSKNVSVHLTPFRDLIKTEKLENFDIALADGASFFHDPDSALTVWSQILSDHFPFPGTELIAEIEKVRHTPDPTDRIQRYKEVMLRHERMNWVVPVLNGNDPVIKKSGVTVPDNMFRPFESICWSSGAN